MIAPPADSLTHVELIWIEKQIEHWIRFGHDVAEQILDRRRRMLSFAPNSVFAYIRWAANDYGTVVSRIDILRAVAPGEPYSTVAYVRPGGEILLRISGWPKVERVLQAIDGVEALGEIKAVPAVAVVCRGCAWFQGLAHPRACRLSILKRKQFQGPRASTRLSTGAKGMITRDDDLRVRPGRIGHGNRGARRPKTFVGEVMRAAKKAGHTGRGFGRAAIGRSTFGRGRRAALLLSMQSPGRRVVVMARVVRQHGKRFRPAPLGKHVAYLKREGVTRDGADARMFDARSDDADSKAFAERCEEDRHHFRFTVSPEDAARMQDLRAFTRELMADAEHDLGTQLDWVAVDHWNTDNPHIHVLIRGRADDGENLVISRDYISRGFRARAAERVTLELGPRSELEVRSTLEREVEAERWTSLDRALRDLTDEGGGTADLRPGAGGEDPELRRLMLGRAAKLERLGLAEKTGPACWTLKPGIEQTLRDLGIRGDIIKTMHRVMTGAGREPDVSEFALHGERPTVPVLGRLVGRGLLDELQGSAYAIVEGVDGRTHHLRFSDLELTGDAEPGAIVEVRAYEDAKGRPRLALATRSDFTIEAQVTASGATWLDRQLLVREPSVSGGGFGAEVHEAMDRRVKHLIEEGLAQRQGQQIVFARDLLATLQRRELDGSISRLSEETGLSHHPSNEGEYVSGAYRQRVTLASGRFAMIDDGLGFQLVPWRPALEQQLGRHVAGVMMPDGRVDWDFGRSRGLGL